MDFLKVHMTVELDVKTYVHQVKECWDEMTRKEMYSRAKGENEPDDVEAKG